MKNPERHIGREAGEMPQPIPEFVADRRAAKPDDVAAEQERQQREYVRVAARLERDVEDAAGLMTFENQALKPSLIGALRQSLENIPAADQRRLLEEVKQRFVARLAEAQTQKLRPEAIRARQAGLNLINEIDSQSSIELDENAGLELELETGPDNPQWRT